MINPRILDNVDDYNLTLADFPTRFHKYLFSAINGLKNNAAGHIEVIDIANYLNSDPTASQIFKGENGIEYLQDALNFANVENFKYYYDKLKKLNLLRDLKKQGFDTSEFYNEDLTVNNEVNAKFEELTVEDICSKIRNKLAGLESAYVTSGEIEVEKASDNILDFIQNLNDTIEIGAPIQGSIYSEVISGAQLGTLTIRSGSSGLGKALPNNTVIPTPNGWKKVGEVKPGDYLFDAFGKPTKVMNIYPQGEKEVYKVTFKDGRSSLCSDEHLWSYCTYSQKTKAKESRKFFTKTLKEIMSEPLQREDGQYRILVPMNYAVEYPKKEFFIPPYLMGLFLGDGSFRQHPTNKSFQYSSEDEFLPNIIGKTMNWNVKKGSNNNCTWYFSTKEKQDNQFDKINVWVEDVVQEYPTLLNVDSKTKFIPTDYLYGSVKQRIDLLNGLLDSDGSVDNKGRIAYYTISEQLRDNVIELCHSLGFKTHTTEDAHKATNIGYIVSIQGRPEEKVKLFNLPRKKEIIEKWYNSSAKKETNDFNPIVKIESLNYKEEMTCFYVDNEEHLFLTNDFIVTHNTRQAIGDACYLAYPMCYNESRQEWRACGSSEKVLFIVTEQTFKEARKMILAYLSDINDSRFKLGNFNADESKRLQIAAKIMQDYEENLILVKMPNPTIASVKAKIRENCLKYDIHYVFYDYIFIGPSLLGEFRGFNLRNDKLLSYI